MTGTNVVEMLQLFAPRPALFVGNDDQERVELWLAGFMAAIEVQVGLMYERRQIREGVWTARGWALTSTSSWRQMLARKMSAAEIIAELVNIEIDYLNQVLS